MLREEKKKEEGEEVVVVVVISCEYIPLRCSLFFSTVFKMKSLSKVIFKTKSNGIMNDRDFI